ncbi:MAG TPA: methyltransferase [Burkholderiales bacterium]|nr:methyltransferase [Burkholderiales bacterium]
MKPFIRTALLSVVLACFSSPTFAANETELLLDQAIAGNQRDAKSKARDRYRHPKETLLFFGLKSNMTVVEIWPGAGWYTEILAPVLRDRGRLYEATYALQSKATPEIRREIGREYLKTLAQHPGTYDKIILTELQAPEYTSIAPRGSADMVLTFRNVHNWAKDGNAEATFKAFYEALKPGGILGVTDHRAKPGTTLQDMIRSGYVTEDYVIELAQRAGFRLVAKSEINGNPKDSKNYPKGVWTLPPTLRLGNQDREKYLAIGESDRMTLKFVKPK